MCFNIGGQYKDILERINVPVKERKIDYMSPKITEEVLFERGCNQEKVPFLECETTCCCDCTNMYSCKYVCSNLDKDGNCTEYD